MSTLMIARSENWLPRRPDARRTVASAAALGAVLAFLSFALLSVDALENSRIIDTPVYRGYGEAVLDGKVPYRDFSLEYPPAALPVFILPAALPVDDYDLAFGGLSALLAAVAAALVAVCLGRLGATSWQLYGGAAFAGLAPFALGTVVLSRYDYWPAALTVAALAALLFGRERLAFGVLGVAVAAKIYPAVVLPLLFMVTAGRRGGREALVSLGIFAAVLGAIVVPFAILAPDGLVESLQRQTDRPLQIESIGSAFLMIANQVGSYEPTVVSSFGSQNMVGELPDALATVQTVLQALAVVAIWMLFVRRRGSLEALVAGSAAAVAAFVAFGKVLSPQFLIWLVPLVPLVAGSLGLVAGFAFLLALLLTHLWFPERYLDLVALAPSQVWLLVARDIFLVGLAAILVAAMARERARPHSA